MSAAPNSTPQLDHALFYARLGWSVVPSHKVIRLQGGKPACTCRQGEACISKGKHPAIDWIKFQKAPATIEQIQTWFTGYYADYGVGIITGAVSGIFVIDVDEAPGKAGGETLNDVQMIHGDIPHTVQAKTGGGGKHIILRHPGGRWINTAKNVFGPGVDVRGDGGFIVTAPSLHESGRFYLWDEDAHPRTTQIADAPDWVIELAETSAPSDNGPRKPSTGSGEIIRDAWGKVTDGRERHMVGIVCGVIADQCRQSGGLPEAEAVFAEAWPTYERTTRARGDTLEADGRGETLMLQRIGHMLRRAASGKWRVQQDADNWTGDQAGSQRDGTKANRPGLPLVYFSDIQPNLDAADFVEGLLIEGGMSVIYGESNCGKTFFMTDLGIHAAMGRKWRDREIEPGGVIYCALEGSHGISNRVAAFRHYHKLGPLELPFAIVPVAINLLDPNADTPRLIEAINRAAADLAIKVRLVVIDTLSRAMAGGNENAPDDMGALVANTDGVRQATGAHIAFVHHSGKDTAKGARGHSLLRAATDTEIEISRADKDSPSIAKVTKQRELEIDGEFVFRLQTVELGTNRRGKPVTSCVVVPDDEPAQPSMERGKGRNLPPNGALGTRALSIAIGRAGAKLPETSDYPHNTVAVSATVWRDEFYQLKAGSSDTNKHAFSSAETVLLARNVITARNGLVWFVRQNEAG